MAAQTTTQATAARRTRVTTLQPAVLPAPTFQRETDRARSNAEARRVFRLKCALAALVE